MRRTLIPGIVFAGLATLSGCVGGGYAFSDTYRGVIYEDAPPLPSHARSHKRRSYEAGTSGTYSTRYVRRHRSVGYEYGPRG